MFEVIERTLWGNVTKEELKEFGLLSSVFFLILAAFQMLRIIKDSTFITLVGPQNLPYAKMVSLVSFFLIVLFFNKMVDWFDHAMLVYVISTFYGVLFLIFAYLLSQSTVGAGQLPILINQGLGWAVYIAAESLGSFVVAVFWSFAEVISHVNTSTAKRGYPLIVLGGELGAFLGAFLLMTQATKIGVPMLAYIAAGTLLVVPLVIKLYTVKYPEKHKVEPKKTTGIIEGIKLICTKRYLMGILVISTAFELISFLYEYQMHSAAHKTFGSIEKITEFLGIYGLH